MKNKKIIFACFIGILILIVFLICCFLMTKNLKTGNNKSSQEVVENILNMKTYEAVIEVDVKSNKNENKYVIKQIYNNEEDSYQEVLEPSNIKGVKIIKKEGELKLENTNLNLVSIFENYEYLSESNLDLNSFISDYKESNYSKYKENIDEIVMETTSKNDSKTEKNLYINKKTGMPTRLEINDTNKKNAVYILYREVNVNSK